MTALSSAICSQSQKIVKFVIFGPMIFLNCARMYDLTDVPASNYDRKTDGRPFDTIHYILQCLSRVQSLLKGRNAPIWREREPTHLRLSGADGLSEKIPLMLSVNF